MTALAPIIAQFMQDYLPRQRGFSTLSSETYAHAFKLLFQFAARRVGSSPSQLSIEQLDAPLILAFLDHLETDRGNGATSRNARLAAIKSFMRFVEYQYPALLAQIAQIRAIPTKRCENKLVQHLSKDEVQAVLNAPDVTTRLGARDRAMMHLCFAGGLRVSELDRSGSRPDSKPAGSRKRAKASALSALEADSFRLAGLACRAGACACTGDLRQCRRESDDAIRVRVCARQTRRESFSALPIIGGAFSVAPPAQA